jgi:hypothetical protein
MIADDVTVLHDKDMARAHLTALDPTASRFTFQLFSDDRQKRYAEIVHGTLDEVWPKVLAFNTQQRGVGVFVTVNETDFDGRSRNNIIRIRANMLDADSDEQVARCEEIFAECGVVPNIKVTTGRGAHFYFLVSDESCDEFTNSQQALNERLGTDKAVKDTARVMRLGGTLHLKDPQNPRLVTLERANHHPQWTKGALAVALGLGFAAKPPVNPGPVLPSPQKTSYVAIGGFDDPIYHAWVQKHFGHLTDRLSDGLEADVEEIRSAALAIPPSVLASEHDWVRFTRGIAHAAATFPASSEELYAIVDKASRQAPGFDPEENLRRWRRFRDEAFDREQPITVATVFDMARRHGWTGRNSRGTNFLFLPPSAVAPRALSISSLPSNPKKRQWICGTYAMRGAISMLSAPGARGKTSWLVTFMLSVATGRPLLGAHVFGGPKKVLYLSAEENIDEINRRIRAAMQHHNIAEADLSSLHVIGADRWGLHLVNTISRTPSLDETGWAALRAELDRLQPDIVIIDPLINFLGGADVNDNAVAGLLMGHLAREAAVRNIAVMIAHHVAKGRDPKAAESSMGAASYVNLCRIGLSIDPLQEADAGKVGLPPWEAKNVFRVIATKQNYSPVKSEDDWFQFVSEQLQNPEPPAYPNGDSVGVVKRFTPAASGAALFPVELLRSALQAIQDAEPPLTPSAQSRTRYAVPVIAKAIAPHRGGNASEPEAKAVLGHLIDVGLASVEERKIDREGGRSDMRKGLFPTAAGAGLLRETITPQTPQSPAVASAGNTVDAGGDPSCGSPATQGGYGGNAGESTAGVDPVSHGVPMPALEVEEGGRSGSLPHIAPHGGGCDGVH